MERYRIYTRDVVIIGFVVIIAFVVGYMVGVYSTIKAIAEVATRFVDINKDEVARILVQYMGR